MKLYVSRPLSHGSAISGTMDIQREKLSNGGPECDALVGEVQKNANDVLKNQINDGSKDRDTSTGERTSLGTLYNNVRWE
jgi:hypothetical protein